MTEIQKIEQMIRDAKEGKIHLKIVEINGLSAYLEDLRRKK